ncbi:YncE family protein [Flavilitoribacter nigricans]|uniref:YncE family protein n=1 Tax=Flavilitoribacter nigricans (strain ATCC 23147 / DSM 23189 / NBRC 102662 / NCIMB 1420 / SS-2) TaxID=1122177 RepID=A0A2D0N891_FLAN2|nr:YncE family protein [Flavilitoribacter nigricans]PHN04705.1 hypothetical protein CRP01_19510 [Flavilitoribacter nigricans DSM 23189 = NBRC 102662]
MNTKIIFRPALLLGSLLVFTYCQTAPADSGEVPITPATPWELIVVEQGAGTVSILDPQTGQKKKEIAVGYNPHEIALSADNRTAYVSNFGIEDYDRTIGTPGLNISVIDIPTGQVTATFPTNRRPELTDNQAPHGIRLRPGRPQELYVNVEVGDSMLVYDTGSGQIRRTFPLPPGAHNFIFSPSGDTIFLFSGEEGIFSFRPETGEQLAHFETGSASRGLTYTLDGKYLIVSCGDEIYLLDPTDLSVHRHYPELGVRQIIYSTPAPDGKHILAPCPYDGVVLLIDMESGQIVRRMETGKAPIYVQVAPGNEKAYIANAMDTHLSVLDLAAFTLDTIGGVNRPNGFGFIGRPVDK